MITGVSTLFTRRLITDFRIKGVTQNQPLLLIVPRNFPPNVKTHAQLGGTTTCPKAKKTATSKLIIPVRSYAKLKTSSVPTMIPADPKPTRPKLEGSIK